MPETHEKSYEIFKNTREERGLSLSEVANALHLTVTMIEQIEAGEFVHRHLAPVFMRGYIRSYAKYLNLPENIVDEMVSPLNVENIVKPAPEKSMPFDKNSLKKPSTPHNFKKISSYLLVVALLIIAASFWHGKDKPKTPELQPEPQVESIVQPPEITLPEPTEETFPLTPEENTVNPPEMPSPEPEALAPAPIAEVPPPPPVKKAPSPVVSTQPEVIEAQETP